MQENPTHLQQRVEGRREALLRKVRLPGVEGVHAASHCRPTVVPTPVQLAAHALLFVSSLLAVFDQKFSRKLTIMS